MASGRIFDLMALLRAAPLVTSSFSLWYCVDQSIFYGNFVRPENRAKSNEMLPLYWKSIFKPSTALIIALYCTSAAVGFANVAKIGPGSALAAAGAKAWYGAGAALSLAHFCFVPAVMYKIKAIVDDEPKGDTVSVQERWLSVHAFRSCTVDLAGWACFLVAVSKGLSFAV